MINVRRLQFVKFKLGLALKPWLDIPARLKRIEEHAYHIRLCVDKLFAESERTRNTASDMLRTMEQKIWNHTAANTFYGPGPAPDNSTKFKKKHDQGR